MVAPQPPGADPHRPSGGDQEPDFRIGHAEREAVVARLEAAFAEGRLEVAEFDERMGATYAAKTSRELAPLTADLPGPVSAAASQPARQPAGQPAVERSVGRSGKALRLAWRAWATVVFVNVVVWLVVSLSSADFVYFWPVWVAGPWGAVLLAATLFRDRDVR